MKKLPELLRFSVVGITATCVHLVITWMLLSFNVMSSVNANALGFVLAFFVAFAGHFKLTFQDSKGAARSMVRYFIVAISCLGAESVIIVLMERNFNASPHLSVLVAITIVPAISFLASKNWAFKST